MLGDASLVAPVPLLQLLVLTPAFLTLLDMATSMVGSSLLHRLAAPLRNPVLHGCLSGVLSSALDVTPPPWLAASVALLGDMPYRRCCWRTGCHYAVGRCPGAVLNAAQSCSRPR